MLLAIGIIYLILFFICGIGATGFVIYAFFIADKDKKEDN